ncbi:MAG: hypoxanthine-guanine phosphoribosyltransferase [Betaproteobacteria bacterium]|nr:MAG: hypoxanthine-guanine phosphoribosyltransferase [Betaproteobacteria bacterium]
MDRTVRAWQILESAELIHSAAAVDTAIARVAAEITAVLRDQYPLVLSVMGGAVVFTGRLLPLLNFPLDFDYIHASRYGATTGGGPVEWIAEPKGNVSGRVVLVLDDILDIGDTMLAIRERILGLGARAFYSAVLTDKKKNIAKPINADFVGLALPDRYVFGCGMDAFGAWRNLPAIYALRQNPTA